MGGRMRWVYDLRCGTFIFFFIWGGWDSCIVNGWYVLVIAGCSFSMIMYNLSFTYMYMVQKRVLLRIGIYMYATFFSLSFIHACNIYIYKLGDTNISQSRLWSHRKKRSEKKWWISLHFRFFFVIFPYVMRWNKYRLRFNETYTDAKGSTNLETERTTNLFHHHVNRIAVLHLQLREWERYKTVRKEEEEEEEERGMIFPSKLGNIIQAHLPSLLRSLVRFAFARSARILKFKKWVLYFVRVLGWQDTFAIV